jgi:hypothetical protein
LSRLDTVCANFPATSRPVSFRRASFACVRYLQVLVLVVHIRPRLAFMSASILVRPARLQDRKSEDRGFPGTGTHKGEHVEIRERPCSDLPPRPKDIELAKESNPTGRAEETTPLRRDSVVLLMIVGDRCSIRLTKRARGLVKLWQSPANVLQTHQHQRVSVRLEPFSPKHRQRTRGSREGRDPQAEWAWQKPNPFLPEEPRDLPPYGVLRSSKRRIEI